MDLRAEREQIKMSKFGHSGLGLRETSESERAFTLVELALVIVLLVTMSALAVSKFDALDLYRQRASMRSFLNTWEFLFQQAHAKGDSYRLLVNLDRASYTVRREVPVASSSKTVDRVANLRLESERQRLQQKEDEKLLSLEEEYIEEDSRQGDTLENLYFGVVFRDPEGSFRLGVPLDFPSLAKDTKFINGLRLRDIVVGGEKKDSGVAAIRFSSRGTGEFALVHFLLGNSVVTAYINPATGKVTVKDGDIEITNQELLQSGGSDAE